jgi:hypothetical protein
MNLENLHAHMHINALANGTAEVLFMGQPALSVNKSNIGSIDSDGNSGQSFCWVINPVFAKLTYGANVLSDIPYCSKHYPSIEHAAADGMAELEERGAFKTITELPDDTYSNAKKYVEDDIMDHSFTKGGLSESIRYVTALNMRSLKPSISFGELSEKVVAKTELSESEKLARAEYALMGMHIFSGELVSEGSEEATGSQTMSERTMTLFEEFKAEKRRIQIEESHRLLSTHESGNRTAKVYKCSETGEHVTKFFKDGKHQKDADYFTDDKADAQGTAKHWISKNKLDEAISDDDYYVVNPDKKTIVSRIGKPIKRVDPYSDPTNHPEFKSAISDPNHKVMRGMKAKFAGFLEEATRSEFDANNSLADKRLTGKKSIRIIGPTGGTVSKHDSLSDAKRSFIQKKLSTKTHTIQEITDDGEVDITALFESDEEDYNKWASDVQSKHGDKKIVIRHRVEKGVHTSSAEVPGEDRSYAVYDHEKNQGHIFEESVEIVGEEVIEERELSDSEKSKKEEIVAALKGRKGFTSKYGKDAIYAVATQMAKTAGQ